MDCRHYDLIKSNWGATGSWAIYHDDYGDYELNFSLIEKCIPLLKPNFVFCALNSSFETLRTWQTFHVRYPGGKGAILRDTFNNSPVFKGSYLTDLIKRHVDPHSGQVIASVSRDPELLQLNLDLFRRELDDLRIGEDYPIVFAVGGAVHSLLKGSPIASLCRIESVTHYSAYGKDSGKFRKQISMFESLI